VLTLPLDMNDGVRVSGALGPCDLSVMVIIVSLVAGTFQPAVSPQGGSNATEPLATEEEDGPDAAAEGSCDSGRSEQGTEPHGEGRQATRSLY